MENAELRTGPGGSLISRNLYNLVSSFSRNLYKVQLNAFEFVIVTCKFMIHLQIVKN